MTPDAEGPVGGYVAQPLPDEAYVQSAELEWGRDWVRFALEMIRTVALVVIAIALVIIA